MGGAGANPRGAHPLAGLVEFFRSVPDQILEFCLELLDAWRVGKRD